MTKALGRRLLLWLGMMLLVVAGANAQLTTTGAGKKPAAAAVAFDSIGSEQADSGVRVVPFSDASLTNNAGNAIIVLFQDAGADQTLLAMSMTWDGNALTQLVTATGGCRVDIWGIVGAGASTGNKTLVVNWTGAANFTDWIALSFSGATSFAHTATGTTSATVTSSTSGKVAGSFCSTGVTGALSGTSIYVNNAIGAGANRDNGAASVNLTSASGIRAAGVDIAP